MVHLVRGNEPLSCVQEVPRFDLHTRRPRVGILDTENGRIEAKVDLGSVQVCYVIDCD
jgi:hypothetical protein